MPDNISQPINVTGTVSTAINSFFAQVYGWMTIGLMVTALVSALVSTNVELQYWIYTNGWVLPLILVLELVVVLGLSFLARRLNAFLAAGLFLFYAALNGIFFGVIVTAYTTGSVFLAFGVSAAIFLGLGAYGYFTKSDLTRFGTLAIVGLFGIILGSLINLFLRSEGINWLLTYLGIAVFLVLIAYDTQKIKRIGEQAEMQGNITGGAIQGALVLYLDFINLFIRILQIFGKRR
jgi:FtsH-binding integral membrane protein